jgi:hypothetical protein
MNWIAAPVAAALITVLLGNWLLHRWQLRNWFTQQRHAGHEKELEELSKLLDEILLAASTRLEAMRLLRSEMATKGDVNKALGAYKEQISAWNIKLHSWFARITFYLNWSMTYALENRLHSEFVRTGWVLERSVREYRTSGTLSAATGTELTRAMNALAGEIDDYLRDFLRFVDSRRTCLRYGRHLKYNSHDIREYSTFQLFKSLFSADVDAIDIVRAA